MWNVSFELEDTIDETWSQDEIFKEIKILFPEATNIQINIEEVE